VGQYMNVQSNVASNVGKAAKALVCSAINPGLSGRLIVALPQLSGNKLAEAVAVTGWQVRPAQRYAPRPEPVGLTIAPTATLARAFSPPGRHQNFDRHHDATIGPAQASGEPTVTPTTRRPGSLQALSIQPIFAGMNQR
jgi:hypothetical protein